MTFPLTPIRTPNSKPALKQIWEMINLGSRLVATPNDYAIYRLYEQGKTPQDALRFLSGPRVDDLCTSLNPEPQMLKDKVKYDARYTALNLPIPQALALVGANTKTNYVHLNTETEIENFLTQRIQAGHHLVIKEVAGMQGVGVLVIVDLITVEDKQFLVLSNGTTKSLTETATELLKSGTWMIQDRLKQHKTLDSLNSTSLNTIRVGTFLNQDGTVDIDYAVLRIGRAYSQIDAYAGGGVAVRVDLNTGQLSEFGQQKLKYSREPIAKHPDSGVAFRDIHIPFWDEVRSMATQFASNAGKNRSIGWDVSITPEGPVFVEGNHNWDAHLAQVGAVGLLSDSFIDRLHQETDLKISATEMPRPQPLRAMRLLRRAH